MNQDELLGMIKLNIIKNSIQKYKNLKIYYQKKVHIHLHLINLLIISQYDLVFKRNYTNIIPIQYLEFTDGGILEEEEVQKINLFRRLLINLEKIVFLLMVNGNLGQE